MVFRRVKRRVLWTFRRPALVRASFTAGAGVVLEFSSLSGGIMLEGIFQPTHLILAFPIFLALFFGVLYLAVRVVRAAWKR